MKLVCLSDTHGRHHDLNVPEGDILLHAGDFTRRGSQAEIADFNQWLGQLSHPHKVVIAGNHDFLFEQSPLEARKLLNNAHYLEDSGVTLMGLRIWGSPVSPRFFDWAFNRERGSDIRRHWSLIPNSTDILITHTPAHGLLDKIWLGRHVGCEALRRELENRLKPMLVVCGHIHENAGHLNWQGMNIINASSLDRRYRPRQPIWTVEISERRVNSVSAIPHHVPENLKLDLS